jgi:hypothetical protein
MEVCAMQSAQVSLNAIYQRTLESRMMGNCHVRFGRGPMEKYPDKGQLASGLPYGQGIRKLSAVGFGGAVGLGAAQVINIVFPFATALI